MATGPVRTPDRSTPIRQPDPLSGPPAGLRRLVPSAARTRIIGWMLLLVMAALGIATFVTWRLLVSAVNHRMDEALRIEVEEFAELTGPGIDPATGTPFTSVDKLIRDAIAFNIARPNEKFLGYLDGDFLVRSRQQPETPDALSDDPAFTRRVATVTEPIEGTYHDPQFGEIRYLAMPVTLADDPHRGVIVSAFFGDIERAEADRAARLMLAVGGATIAGAAVAAWLIAGRILRPLRDVADTAQRITDTDLSARIPARGGDELGSLVRTVNGMLDRLEAALSEQRRFTDDAGHELRTPITIVRGHLDVMDPADPDDVASTVALVDDELDRMNRMVSDLLLLARSEQPTFLRLSTVDVGALTRDVFEKVSRLGAHVFTLEGVAEMPAVLDPQRITQALIALADNACRYTPDGGRIGIGSAAHDGWLRFWVTDSGPGIAEADRDRIFGRFSRGGAGARQSEGAGLGLAIVRAIAGAHGGTVELDSAGPGATFVIRIPVKGDPWPES
ncbi:HAMP domain-containing histidine kinase [Mycobacterium sp. Y57]|nr:HAMP domain-containing histidine kinase [Mycolicibacterium xanthum]